MVPIFEALLVLPSVKSTYQAYVESAATGEEVQNQLAPVLGNAVESITPVVPLGGWLSSTTV
jgi:hypothetical protein